MLTKRCKKVPTTQLQIVEHNVYVAYYNVALYQAAQRKKKGLLHAIPDEHNCLTVRISEKCHYTM